jgi:hypothetical protein
MYFALDQNIDSVENYISFLKDIIETDNDYYKSIFKEIIEESKKLRLLKNYYSINRERFGIISLLAENAELLDSIDSQNLKKIDFKKLLKTIENDSLVRIQL